MDKIIVAMVIKKLSLISKVEIFLSGSKGSNQDSNKVWVLGELKVCSFGRNEK